MGVSWTRCEKSFSQNLGTPASLDAMFMSNWAHPGGNKGNKGNKGRSRHEEHHILFERSADTDKQCDRKCNAQTLAEGVQTRFAGGGELLEVRKKRWTNLGRTLATERKMMTATEASQMQCLMLRIKKKLIKSLTFVQTLRPWCQTAENTDGDFWNVITKKNN